MEFLRKYFREVKTEGFSPSGLPSGPGRKPKSRSVEPGTAVIASRLKGRREFDLEALHDALEKRFGKTHPVYPTRDKEGKIFSVNIGNVMREAGKAHPHFSQFTRDSIRVRADEVGREILNEVLPLALKKVRKEVNLDGYDH